MLSFISAPNFEAPTDADGDNVYEVTVKVTDGAGLFDTQAIAVTVTDSNDAPVSTDDSETTAAGAPVILGLDDFGSYADPEGTAIAAVKITALQNDGRLEHKTSAGGAWTAVVLNEVISAADISAGWLRFVPDGNESGSPYATVGFHVGDGASFSTNAYVLTLNVTTAGHAPVFVAGGETAGEVFEDDGDPMLSTMGVLEYADADGSDDHIATTTHDSGTLGGTLSAPVFSNGDGTGTVEWLYEVTNADVQNLAEGEAVTESFTLQLSDGAGGSATEQIDITIWGVNDAPVITSGGGSGSVDLFVTENTTAVTDVNAFDVDNASELTYLIVGGADWALFSMDSESGVLAFQDAPVYVPGGDNEYHVDVQVFDEHDAMTEIQSIAVHVLENNAPNAVDENVITNLLEQPFNIPEWVLLANDTDDDGDAIDVRDDATIANSVSGGSAEHFPEAGTAGYVQFILVNDEGGGFNYRALDQRGAASSEATVNVKLDNDGNLNLDGTPDDDILVVGLDSGATSVFGLGGNDILVGEGGGDTLNGGSGADILAGGEGGDIFDYNALADAGDTVTDFSKSEGDKLDLHDLLATLEILGGSENAFDAGYLRFTPAGDDTLVEVSGDGDPGSFETLATLIGVQLSSTDTDCFVL
jgi:VCBS repeat-containing protein